jgi:hypothetical protein
MSEEKLEPPPGQTLFPAATAATSASTKSAGSRLSNLRPLQVAGHLSDGYRFARKGGAASVSPPLPLSDSRFKTQWTLGCQCERCSSTFLAEDHRFRWRASASPCDPFEYPARERHLRRAPYVSLLEGPGVDRVAVAHQLEEAWFGEFCG